MSSRAAAAAAAAAAAVPPVPAARSMIYLGMDVHKDSITIAVLPALEVVSKPTEHDKHARNVHEGAIVLEQIVVARDESTEVVQPRVRALNDPPPQIAAQATTVLEDVRPGAEMGDDQLNAAALEASPERPTVVAAVGNDALRVLPRTPGPRPRHRYRRERRFRELDFVDIGSRKVDSERKTRAVDQYHKLCPLTFACRADASAPFFAGANVPSIKASLQSICLASSSSLRNARQSVSQTPAASHSWSRRQQLAYAGNSLGMSFQRAPVRSTHRIPSRHARSSARGRPPFGFSFAFGKCGAIFAHCASVSCGFITPPLGERHVASHTIQPGFRNCF